MSDVSTKKKRLRNRLRAQRDELTNRDSKSQRIRKRLLALPQVTQANMICCFVSFRSEVETHELIDQLLQDGKQVCVPWCHGDVLELCRIDSLAELEPRTMGILEPPHVLREDADRQRQIRDAQVVIVPGLAFTESGARLGYGKGHYDRMLSRAPETTRIAVAFESQIVDDLPTDQFDIPMQWIATDERLIECDAAPRS